MFENLTGRFTKIFDKIRNSGIISEGQIKEVMEEIKLALLDSDVALPVVKKLTDSINEQILGKKIGKSFSADQIIRKAVYDEIVNVLSLETDLSDNKLNLHGKAPINILLVGLQGSGKTTHSAKLAYKLKKTGKKILLVSLDTYRPAAYEQLAKLAKDADIDCLPIMDGQIPVDIAKRGMQTAQIRGYDIVIYDSAGRLHIDEIMLDEVTTIRKLLNPTEILLVVDAMMGQQSVNVASIFDQKLNVTGVMVSRMDGDAKGGVILSVCATIKKSIKFLGIGEKLNDLEEFDAKIVASRILDMGDILSLAKKAEEIVDKDESKRLNDRMKMGLFNVNDYLVYLTTIKKMGGVMGFMKALPGFNSISGKLENVNNIISKDDVIISSMTKKERLDPSLLNASRKKRIATGSGADIRDINKFLKNFEKIKEMVKKTSKMDYKTLKRNFGKFFS